MGTNFYWDATPPCPECGRPYDKERHIGKSSSGWAFALHVYPDVGINTLEDWKALWRTDGSRITDEYGHRYGVTDIERIITQRTRAYDAPVRRAPIDDGNCIGHGEGTWDYIDGEFS